METASLVTLIDSTSFITESYKLLRTNLNFKNVNNRYQVILMTSAGKEEGKTTTICNLAVTFAQSGKRVLLIDADLRLPRVDMIFDINKRKKGLSNMLVDTLPLDSLVNRIDNLDKLDILTAGNKQVSPTELLNSDAFEKMIIASRDEYDIILIDTPPVLSFADASIISKVVDGVLLVVASHKTKKAMVVEAKKNLDKVGASIIGVILTKVKFKRNDDYYRYSKKKS
jgi:capsular exopolysaccharide synthesis family protein